MPYHLTKDGQTTIVQTTQQRDRYLRHGWQLVEKPKTANVKPPAIHKPAPKKIVKED